MAIPKPPVDGYYWVNFKDGEGPRIVRLETWNLWGLLEHRVLFFGSDQDAELEDYPDTLWVGPLDIPDVLKER